MEDAARLGEDNRKLRQKDAHLVDKIRTLEHSMSIKASDRSKSVELVFAHHNVRGRRAAAKA